MAKVIKVLLDSSYILPSFGIEISELSDDDLLKLEALRASNVVRFFYSDIIWIEILPKVVKEYNKKGLQLNGEVVRKSVESLMKTAELVSPGLLAVVEALNLRLLGHGDMIDNLLYGIAVEKGFNLLSMDKDLKAFLKRKKLQHGVIMDHKELFAIVEQ